MNGFCTQNCSIHRFQIKLFTYFKRDITHVIQSMLLTFKTIPLLFYQSGRIYCLWLSKSVNSRKHIIDMHLQLFKNFRVKEKKVILNLNLQCCDINYVPQMPRSAPEWTNLVYFFLHKFSHVVDMQLAFSIFTNSERSTEISEELFSVPSTHGFIAWY